MNSPEFASVDDIYCIRKDNQMRISQLNSYPTVVSFDYWFLMISKRVMLSKFKPMMIKNDTKVLLASGQDVIMSKTSNQITAK